MSSPELRLAWYTQVRQILQMALACSSFDRERIESAEISSSIPPFFRNAFTPNSSMPLRIISYTIIAHVEESAPPLKDNTNPFALALRM